MSSRVRTSTALVLALAAPLAGCSTDGSKEDSGPTTSSSASARPSSSASPTARPSASPTAITGSGGRLLVVPADSPGTGRCSPAFDQGVVCSADRRTTYRFQPGTVRTAGVDAATAEDDPANGWQVQLSMTPQGTTALAAATRVAARTRQLLLVLAPRSHRLLSAPQVNEAIVDGEVQISGDLTESQARRIVRQVTSGGG